MKAALFHEHGGPEVLRVEEFPTPSVGEEEVLVRVRACALNHLDLWVRRGLPGLKLELPHIGGSDIAGVVAETGARVRDIQVGQRVVVDPNLSCGRCGWCRAGQDSLCDSYGIIGEHTRGGFAEFVVVPARNVLALPDHVPFEQAAAVPLVFLTAWRMVVSRARVRPGETVLIVGAGGGVASAALQIVKLLGATAYATAGSPQKLEKAKEWGADEVINHREVDFSKAIWRLTDKRGVDVVIDPVGGPQTFPRALRALKKNGRYVTCGTTTGPVAEVDLRLVFWKQLQITGSTMGTRRELSDALRLVWQGKLKPVIFEVLPLHEIAKAHRMIESREVFGKLVLVP